MCSRISVVMVCVVLLAVSMTACNTTQNETTTTYPDGRIVTEKTNGKTVDAASLQFAQLVLELAIQQLADVEDPVERQSTEDRIVAMFERLIDARATALSSGQADPVDLEALLKQAADAGVDVSKIDDVVKKE